MTKDDLTHYAEQKKRALQLTMNKRFDRNQYQRREAVISTQIMQDVTADKGADGKPLFSNEQARKAEAQRREDANVEIGEIRAHLQRVEAEIAEAEIDIAYFNDMIRIGCAELSCRNSRNHHPSTETACEPEKQVRLSTIPCNCLRRWQRAWRSVNAGVRAGTVRTGHPRRLPRRSVAPSISLPRFVP